MRLERDAVTRVNHRDVATKAMSAAADEEAIESLAAEHELLSAMFGDDKSDVDADHGVFDVVLRPQETGEAQRFVEATLRLTASIAAGYPSSAAAVRLLRARGLLDEEEAELLDVIKSKAAECASHAEPSLFALLECAVEQLTTYNAGGVCPVCRDPLFEPEAPGGPPRAVFLSPCYHNFHKDCLGAWWHACAGAPKEVKAGEAPSRGAAARAEATAAAATARELRNKAGTQADSVHALAARCAQLQALIAEVADGGGASADRRLLEAELRKAQEESKEATAELGRLESRSTKAEKRASELNVHADAVAEAETAAASEAQRSAPLPCPACRAEISAASLEAGGVGRAPPPLPDISECVQLTPEQRSEQQQRQRLFEQQQQRQGQQPPKAEAEAAPPPPPPKAPPQQQKQRGAAPPSAPPTAPSAASQDAAQQEAERGVAQMAVASRGATSTPQVPPGLLPGAAGGPSSASAASGSEKREAPDGNMYTKDEFFEFFGDYEHWNYASPPAVTSAPTVERGGRARGGRGRGGRGRAGRGS